MKKAYTMNIAGVERDLPLCKVNDSLQIAAFIIFGDVEMTMAAAKALLEKAPEYDVLITSEAKSIPLIHEMARQAGDNYYVVARKGPKVYMEDVITVEVKSITTSHVQTLCIGKDIGRNIKAPSIMSIKVIPKSPPAERLSTTLCFLVLNLAISRTYL